jgi:hypothetical protein
MRIYTVHEPPEKRREKRRGPDRFLFVRDGFHFWALVSAPLWLIWHSLWLGFIGYVILAAALTLALRALGVPEQAAVLIYLLLGILVALEAPSLRRWKLRRKGWRTLGVVAAPDYEAAERRFFDSWEGGSPVRPPSLGKSRAYRRGTSDVLGVFPEPEASR